MQTLRVKVLKATLWKLKEAIPKHRPAECTLTYATGLLTARDFQVIDTW